MYSKEQFKEMSDKDILDKYSRFDCFYYEEQLLMLDELKERKHITQEERDSLYEKTKTFLEKRNEENMKYQKPEKKAMSKGKRVVLALGILFIIKVILPVSLFYMGNSAYRNNEYPKAEKLYRASALLNKGYTPSTVMLGTVLANEGEEKEALNYLLFAENIYKKRGEEDEWVLRGLARSYLNLGDYEKFEEIYPKAVKATKDKEMLGYFYKNIALYYWNKDNNKAFIFISKAVFSYSEDPDFYFIRGDINRQRKNYDDAIKDFFLEIEKQKKITDDVYYRLYGCYREGRNDLKNALKYLELYINNYNETPEIARMPMYYIYYQKAELLRDMGDFKGAKEYAEKVLSYDENENRNQKYYDESILEAKKILKSMEKR